MKHYLLFAFNALLITTAIGNDNISLTAPSLTKLSIKEDPSTESILWDKAKEQIQNPARYFVIEPASQIPPKEQFIIQALSFFEQFKIIKEDQSKFLESLLEKVKQPNQDIQSILNLHPYLKDSFATIKGVEISLEKNLNYLKVIADTTRQYIDLLLNKEITLGTVFYNFILLREKILQTRAKYLQEDLDFYRDYKESQANDYGQRMISTSINLFDTLNNFQKYITLYSIEELRVIDEVLYTTLPYLPFGFLPFLNNKIENFIKHDISLMKFFTGNIKVPADPDTTVYNREACIESFIIQRESKGINDYYPKPSSKKIDQLYYKTLAIIERNHSYPLAEHFLKKLTQEIEQHPKFSTRQDLKLTLSKAFEDTLWEILAQRKIETIEKHKLYKKEWHKKEESVENSNLVAVKEKFLKELSEINMKGLLEAYLKKQAPEDLQKNLREQLEKISQKPTSVTSSTPPEAALPAHVRKYLAAQQSNTSSKKGKNKTSPAKSESSKPISIKQIEITAPSPLLPSVASSTEKRTSSEENVSNTSATTIAVESPASAKIKPLERNKISVPQGGWSKRDQETHSKAKKEIKLAEVKSPSAVPVKLFKPVEPIYLTSGQHKVLEKILDGKSSAYTITYDQVVNLLEEGIGIKVLRSGGSHAHLDTPGQNIKILVNIHYGWTDKYGPGTMEELRELMLNLGLNDEKNIMIKKEN